MSYGGYQQYGGNPYGGGSEQGGYGAQNTYGQDVESNSDALRTSDNPYTSAVSIVSNKYRQGHRLKSSKTGLPQPQEAISNSQYPRPDPLNSTPGQPTPIESQPSAIMSNQDFLARVDAVKYEIRQLTTNIGEIGSIHQRILGSPDNASSAQLDNLVSQTQVLNTRIKDQIKQLETDAAKSGRNQTKDSQIRTLKSNFKSQLEDYQREEQTYKTRYREQIARQYRIVNPEASDEEVRQAADANWGDEGVFQTAVCH